MSIRAKKSLGQHFLRSSQVITDIIAAGELSEKDTVLEIGPGKGVLTEALLKHAGRVIAIEKDPELIEILHKKFVKEIVEQKLILVAEDILLFDPTEYFLESGHYKLIANIPYYITGEILQKFLSGTGKPLRMVLLIQKEVAERIVARNGKESILSLSVKAYGVPKIIRKVPAKFFSPSPKVDSSVLVISDISEKNFALLNEALFFKLIKKGFSQKRKKLTNTLSSEIDSETLQSFLSEQKRSLSVRAEDLSLREWFGLMTILQTHHIS